MSAALVIVTLRFMSKGAMMAETTEGPGPDDGSTASDDVVSLEPGPDEPEEPAEEPAEPAEEPEVPAEPAEPAEPAAEPAARPNLW
jgi:hypothetical protein